MIKEDLVAERIAIDSCRAMNAQECVPPKMLFV